MGGRDSSERAAPLSGRKALWEAFLTFRSGGRTSVPSASSRGGSSWDGVIVARTRFMHRIRKHQQSFRSVAEVGGSEGFPA